ncbi:MBL fold metallo-hydrolase [Acuticoccus sp.]|uniref:MBL fold metallo-hydrolase n=1 Tax=Acuticoccus sp. TaxID=1904378 RepID=UPI003B52D693
MAGSTHGPGAFDARRMRPADPWFAVEWHPDGVVRIWEPHVSRLLRANIWLIAGRDRHLLVDAGMGVASLRAFLAPLLDRPVTLLVTHAHVDHVGSAAEFAGDILMHPAEADLLAEPTDWSLTFDTATDERKRTLQASGFDTEGSLIAALPHDGFDPARWTIEPARVTATVDEGDTIDLGDRRLTVLHLPGHTPGSIGLLEEATGTLVGGDAIYDGLIIDTLPESDRAPYAATMRRLRELDVRTVHGGHRESFGREKLIAIADGYLAKVGG